MKEWLTNPDSPAQAVIRELLELSRNHLAPQGFSALHPVHVAV
jgi:hypothetical protein